VTATSLDQQFEAQRTDPPGSADIARLKSDAFEQFSATGFPTRRHENWQYTDLQPISDGGFDFAPQPPNRNIQASVAALLDEKGLAHDEPGLVFIDGYYDEELSSSDAKLGFTLANLASCWESLKQTTPTYVDDNAHPLATLNTAFAQQGALIAVPENIRPSDAVHLVFVGSGRAGLAPQPRVVIELAAGAQLSVVQHFLDLAPADTWLNTVTEVRQAAGSHLTLYSLQEHAEQQFHTALLHAELTADAELTAGYIDLGGRLVRNDLDIKLAKSGATTNLFGVFLPSDGQHIDNHLRVDHLAPDTRSYQAFRGIIGHEGHGVFNGKVVVHPDAQHIDARQSSDNLLLSDRAEIDTKPELEIYADDVKCSHGATIGELDEDQLFYLRSRGVDEDEARSLLTFAFANSILEKIEHDTLRERVALRVAGNLSDSTRLEALS